jgi:hypothetical protein
VAERLRGGPFGVHPLHVESVAGWLSVRTWPPFFLLLLLAYERWAPEGVDYLSVLLLLALD